MDLTALAAKAGPWGDIENALVQYRRDLKFDHAITDCDEARDMIFQIPGLNYGIGEIPMSGMLPGRYLLQVSIIDRVSRQSTTRTTHFDDY